MRYMIRYLTEEGTPINNFSTPLDWSVPIHRGDVLFILKKSLKNEGVPEELAGCNWWEVDNIVHFVNLDNGIGPVYVVVKPTDRPDAMGI